MVGTLDCDIFYIRNGRVPIRPKGCDPSRPQPGSGECEWLGLHPLEDLVQIANPPQGYMQNCNISPFVMMKDSPLVPEKWAEHPYLYNAGRTPPHQRAAMTLEQLAAARNLTLEDAVAMAFSTQVYKAETWQDRIRKADPNGAFAKMLVAWNRRSDAGSRAALAFYLFKMALGEFGSALEPPDSMATRKFAPCWSRPSEDCAPIFRRMQCMAHIFAWAVKEQAGRIRWVVARSVRRAWLRRGRSVFSKREG